MPSQLLSKYWQEKDRQHDEARESFSTSTRMIVLKHIKFRETLIDQMRQRRAEKDLEDSKHEKLWKQSFENYRKSINSTSRKETTKTNQPSSRPTGLNSSWLPDEIENSSSLIDSGEFISLLHADATAATSAQSEHERIRRKVMVDALKSRDLQEMEITRKRFDSKLKLASTDEQDLFYSLEACHKYQLCIESNAAFLKKQIDHEIAAGKQKYSERQKLLLLWYIEKSQQQFFECSRIYRDLQRNETANKKNAVFDLMESLFDDYYNKVLWPSTELRSLANDHTNLSGIDEFWDPLISSFVSKTSQRPAEERDTLNSLSFAKIKNHLEFVSSPNALGISKLLWPGSHKPRILISGPPKSGSRSLGRILSGKFNLIFIDAEKIIQKKLKSLNDLNPNALPHECLNIPDLLIPELESHINTGFVLVGFPETVSDFSRLDNSLVFDIHFMMDTKLDTILSRVTGRYSDEDGNIYNFNDQSIPHLNKINMETLSEIPPGNISEQIFHFRNFHLPELIEYSKKFKSPIAPLVNSRLVFIKEDDQYVLADEVISSYLEFNEIHEEPILEVVDHKNFLIEMESLQVESSNVEFLYSNAVQNEQEYRKRVARIFEDRERTVLLSFLHTMRRLESDFIAIANADSYDQSKNVIAKGIVDEWNSFVSEYSDLSTEAIAKAEYKSRLNQASYSLLEIVEAKRRALEVFLYENKASDALSRYLVGADKLGVNFLMEELKFYLKKVQVIKDAEAMSKGEVLKEIATPELGVLGDFQAAMKAVDQFLKTPLQMKDEKAVKESVKKPGKKDEAVVVNKESMSSLFETALSEELELVKNRLIAVNEWQQKLVSEILIRSNDFWNNLKKLVVAKRQKESESVELFHKNITDCIVRSTEIAANCNFLGSKLIN
jgi:adenylate kinase family enzyme